MSGFGAPLAFPGPWPYNSSSSPPTDAILRTNDNVDFHVHKLVLSLASPVFESMFSLPQPSLYGTATSGPPKRPVIPVSEDSTTIHSLLRYSYPIPDPIFPSFDLLDSALGASIKYQFTEATAIITKTLRDRVPGLGVQASIALHVFAIACRYGDESLASHAAVSCRSTVLSQRGTGFDHSTAGLCYSSTMSDCVSAGSYLRFIQYVESGAQTTFCTPPPKVNQTPLPTDSESSTEPKKRYPFNINGADLLLRSFDGVCLPVQRAILLCNVDPDADKSFAWLCRDNIISSSNDTAGDLPILTMKEDSGVLSMLVTLCYPPQPGKGLLEWSAEQLCDGVALCAIKAARKYGFNSVVQAYLSRIRYLIPQDPLRAYFISCALGWKDEVKNAAIRLAYRATPNKYLPILESLPAKDYYALLRFHWACQDTIRTHLAKQYPLIRPTSQYYTPSSAPRSTWLSREEIQHYMTWPALLEYHMDRMLDLTRNSDNASKNGVVSFDWMGILNDMVTADTAVSTALQALNFGV